MRHPVSLGTYLCLLAGGVFAFTIGALWFFIWRKGLRRTPN